MYDSLLYDNLFLLIPIAVNVVILTLTTKSNSIFATLMANYNDSQTFMVYNCLVCNIMIFISNHLSQICFGRLRESDQGQYNEMALDYLGNVSMTAVSFPYVLNINNLIPFVLFYNIKGLTWVYRLHGVYNVYGVGIVIFIIYKLYTLVNKFAVMFMSFNGLLAFEYFLTLFYMMKYMLLNYFTDCTPVTEYLIHMTYLISRITVVGYYARNLSQFRVPITYLKMLAVDVAELKKKTVVFYNYLALCRELSTIADHEVNDVCAICTDDMTVGKKLGCKHIFHEECLKMWCERESTCPICRKPLSFRSSEEIELDTETAVIRAVSV